MKNLILQTDSYKMSHHQMYSPDTTGVYSYFEARKGARFPYTVFFGLQKILMDHLRGSVVTPLGIERAKRISNAHFGNADIFNLKGWEYIVDRHYGRLPLQIDAVPEGTVVPVDNVLMTIRNTDPNCAWLTNYVESLLMHVWYPSTVATLSKFTIDEDIRPFWEASADDLTMLAFALHDFGYRGATTEDAAALGGMGHLINSKGTDNIPAIDMALDYYWADLANLGFSVPATEHSVMTSEGELREFKVVDRLVDEFPSGILSVVADSYNIYEFVKTIGNNHYKDRILNREGVFVVRPDSVTKDHPTPEDLVEWILWQLWEDFGGEINKKGFHVLNPHVRVLWGDGIDSEGIKKILKRMLNVNFSAENIVFGMGGGLLQKVNRDTQRFAIKASAIKRDEKWYDVQKNPLDQSKASKKGMLQLSASMVPVDGTPHGTYRGEPVLFETGPLGSHHDHMVKQDILETVFKNGDVVKTYTFDEVRANAA